jgi:hypothetical protein
LRASNQFRSHLQRLHALYGLLHLGIEILNAHAQAIEAQAPERLQMLRVGDARIDFDTDLGVRRKGKSLRGEAE